MQDKKNWIGLPKKISGLVEGESDRGAILILGSYLEEILSDVIEDNCLDREVADALLELRGPAGDFDSKIRLSVAFGLIHRLEAKALHCVRRIRNKAAHFDFDAKGSESPFSANSTIDLVANLAELVNLTLPSRDEKVVRDMFVTSSRFVAIRLMTRSLEAKRPPELRTINELAAEAREHLKGTPQGDLLQDAEKQLREGDPTKMMEIMNVMTLAVAIRSAINSAGDEESRPEKKTTDS